MLRVDLLNFSSKINTSCPTIGFLVSRAQWRTARILEMINEQTALVKISPSGLITKRPIQHLYPLEIEFPDKLLISPTKVLTLQKQTKPKIEGE